MANKIFYTILILLILGSVGFTYWRIVIEKDYQIVAEVSCDPSIETCFRYEPEPCAASDSECIPEEAYDYKMISKKAADIYACEQTEEKLGCTEELSCIADESDCEYTNCDLSNPDEADTCSVLIEETTATTDEEITTTTTETATEE
jgi:hypothetical protein